jgi:hypothetical protein
MLLSGLLVLTASGPATAGKVTLAATDVGYIESDGPRPEGRILVRFDLPEAVLASEVEFAVLELRAPVTADEGVICVVVDGFPLTTEWDGATASWDGSWSTPGGDLDRAEHAVWIARPGEESVLRFDVTGMVAGWASGERRNCGLIVRSAPGEAGTMEPADAAGGRGSPVLRVWYTGHSDAGGADGHRR